MVDPLNHGLLMIPSMVLLMKVIPKGVESSMQTFFSVIHGLNMHIIRS